MESKKLFCTLFRRNVVRKTNYEVLFNYFVDRFKGVRFMKFIFKKKLLYFLFIFLLISIPIRSLFPLSAEANNNPASSIGGFEVQSSDKAEIISFLNEKINEWENNIPVVNDNGEELTLQAEWFTFNVEGTVDKFLSRTEKPWFTFWKTSSVVHLPIEFTMSQEVNRLIEKQSHLNAEQTLGNIREKVGILSSEPIESVPLDLSLIPLERVAFTLEEIMINTTSLNDIVTVLNEQVIGSEEVFSLKERIEKINIVPSDETLNYVASILYSVVLKTDFDIVERHSQGVLPPYLEAGIEAEISNSKDFKFINTTDQPASLKFSLKDNSFLVEIYAVPTETEGKYQVRGRQEIKPRTIYRYSPDLAPGEEQLVEEGKPGLRVSVYRTISDKIGPFENEELVSQDYYPPKNRIIIKSVIVPETPTVQDPDLEIDLNGDGLADMGPISTEGDEVSTDPSISNIINNENTDELPEGSYYDKAGNIIDGSK